MMTSNILFFIFYFLTLENHTEVMSYKLNALRLYRAFGCANLLGFLKILKDYFVWLHLTGRNQDTQEKRIPFELFFTLNVDSFLKR